MVSGGVHGRMAMMRVGAPTPPEVAYWTGGAGRANKENGSLLCSPGRGGGTKESFRWWTHHPACGSKVAARYFLHAAVCPSWPGGAGSPSPPPVPAAHPIAPPGQEGQAALRNKKSRSHRSERRRGGGWHFHADLFGSSSTTPSAPVSDASRHFVHGRSLPLLARRGAMRRLRVNWHAPRRMSFELNGYP
jgi:hypothetical protein